MMLPAAGDNSSGDVDHDPDCGTVPDVPIDCGREAGRTAVTVSPEGWTPVRSAAGPHGPWALATIVSIATFMFALDASIAIVALNHIAGGLGASYSEATWVISSYVVAAGLVVPVSGWLSQAIGRKQYYMTCVAIFAASSLACGLAPSLPWLIVARICQGLGGGGMQPLERSMLVDSFPPHRVSWAYGLYGVVALLGPAIGPVLGGYITDCFDWRWIFLMNVPVAALSLVLVAVEVREPDAMREDRARIWSGEAPIDWFGFILVVTGVGLLQYALDQGQIQGWFESDAILWGTIVAVTALVVFVLWELGRLHPILDIRLFRNRNLTTATVIDTLTGAVLYGTTQMMPQLLQEVLGYSAFDAGRTMAAGGVAMLLLMPVAAALSGKVPGRVMVGTALVSMGLSIWPMTQLNTDLSFEHAVWLRLAQSIALPFLFIPISSMALVGVPSGKSAQGSALMELCTGLGGSLSIALTQTILSRRQQFHLSRLVEHLTPYNRAYKAGLERLAGLLQSHGVFPKDGHQFAATWYFRLALEQASVMSFIDLAWFLMALVVLVFPVIFLLPRKRPTDSTH